MPMSADALHTLAVQHTDCALGSAEGKNTTVEGLSQVTRCGLFCKATLLESMATVSFPKEAPETSFSDHVQLYLQHVHFLKGREKEKGCN